jgi:ubiquinone/menaquinone biosynthesis C-methylase UbiE
MESGIKTIEPKETTSNSACGCGSGGCGSHSGQKHEHAHHSDVPEKFQLLQEGDRVVDLGSGTGMDCLTISQLVGPTGKVIGIDSSAKNISTSRETLDKFKISNVEFREGFIDNLPLPHEYANVVYASCVFNLQADKQKTADEMYRIVDHGGYVCVSDFVVINDIPEGLKQEASALAGCIGGAEKVKDFMDYFKKTGFEKGGIVEVDKVQLPQDMLEKYLSTEEVALYNDIDSDYGIFSIVLVVEKPETCASDTCCHNPEKHKN